MAQGGRSGEGFRNSMKEYRARKEAEAKQRKDEEKKAKAEADAKLAQEAETVRKAYLGETHQMFQGYAENIKTLFANKVGYFKRYEIKIKSDEGFKIPSHPITELLYKAHQIGNYHPGAVDNCRKIIEEYRAKMLNPLIQSSMTKDFRRLDDDVNEVYNKIVSAQSDTEFKEMKEKFITEINKLAVGIDNGNYGDMAAVTSQDGIDYFCNDYKEYKGFKEYFESACKRGFLRKGYNEPMASANNLRSLSERIRDGLVRIKGDKEAEAFDEFLELRNRLEGDFKKSVNMKFNKSDIDSLKEDVGNMYKINESLINYLGEAVEYLKTRIDFLGGYAGYSAKMLKDPVKDKMKFGDMFGSLLPDDFDINESKHMDALEQQVNSISKSVIGVIEIWRQQIDMLGKELNTLSNITGDWGVRREAFYRSYEVSTRAEFTLFWGKLKSDAKLSGMIEMYLSSRR